MTDPLQYEVRDGRVVAARGPDGAVQYEVRADGQGIAARMPDGGFVEVVPGREPHPVIGPCDAVRVRGEEATRAFCGRIDWHHPSRIPPLDCPGALPAGAGAALLNALAAQAAHAAIVSLRYHGPYPTHMLFDSLQASFSVDGDVDEARERFVLGAERAAVIGESVEPPVDFVPAPHRLAWPAGDVCVQLRGGQVERVWVGGHAFDRWAGHGRVLRRDGDDLVARVQIGDDVVTEILRLDVGGRPHGAAGSMPAAPADLVGTALPDAVIEVLAEAIAAEASPLLRSAVHDVLGPATVRLGDPGLQLVRVADDHVQLHAGLVAFLPEQPVPLLAVLVGMLGRPVRQLAQRRLSDAAEAILRR